MKPQLTIVPEPQNKKVGIVLRDARRQHKWNHKEAAQRCATKGWNARPITLHRLEQGRQELAINKATILAKVYEIPLESIIF